MPYKCHGIVFPDLATVRQVADPIPADLDRPDPLPELRKRLRKLTGNVLGTRALDRVIFDAATAILANPGAHEC